MIQPEELVGGEWAEWYLLTPVRRWLESEKLWHTYLALGGSLDPEPDTQSPFFDAHAPRPRPAHGRTDVRVLRRGHAVHFRCQHPEAFEMRIDVMSRMRGVDSFPKLWKRCTVIELPDGTRCDLLSLPDLVQAKKTQRDKDWPMIRQLVEAHFFQNISWNAPWQQRKPPSASATGNTGCRCGQNWRSFATRTFCIVNEILNTLPAKDLLRSDPNRTDRMVRISWRRSRDLKNRVFAARPSCN
jgi:hypothetical protein